MTESAMEVMSDSSHNTTLYLSWIRETTINSIRPIFIYVSNVTYKLKICDATRLSGRYTVPQTSLTYLHVLKPNSVNFTL